MAPRVKDFAIPMDEFHPNPSTAAAFADRKANDATVAHLTTDLKRLDSQLEACVEDRAQLLQKERDRVQGYLSQARADRVAIDERIQEARVK